MKHKINKKYRREMMQALSLMTQIGVTMAVCVFIGVLIGKFLDDFFHTTPWLLLLFSIMGVITAFKSLYDIAIKRWNKK